MSWKGVRNNIINNINDQINIFRKTSNCNDEGVLRQNIIKIQYDVCRKIRKNFLNKICGYSKRNILSYYSGFIKSPQAMSSIIPFDRDVIISLMNSMDKRKGLDLILHTPGGRIDITESIVNYIKKIFNNDVRVIIPSIALSTGTMIALSAKEILMTNSSSIGPIDPQFGNGLSCKSSIEMFQRACLETMKEPRKLGIWQSILKFHPTFLIDCEKAIKWSKTITEKWLNENMFHSEKKKIVQSILENLDNEKTYFHGRHLNIQFAKQIGLKVKNIEEEEPELWKILMDYYYACYETLWFCSDKIKIIESNHEDFLY